MMATLTQIRQKARGGAELMRILARPNLAFRPARYVFILSHMRSRSSLLSHILGSHPEISGYFESHIEYKTRLDFLRLRERVLSQTNGKPLGRYVLDKVLHNWYVDLPMMERMKVIPIYLVRKPSESLRSICSSQVIHGNTHEQMVDRSCKYYLKRMRVLDRCVSTLSTRGIFLESTEFLKNTPAALELLRERLELATPLSENYQLFNATGQGVMGDRSDLIKSGGIIRDGTTSYSEAIEPPPARVVEAQHAYDQLVKKLRERCWIVQ